MNNNSKTLFNSHLALAGFNEARSLTIMQGDKTDLEFILKDKNSEPIVLEQISGQAQIVDSEKDTLVAVFDVKVEGSKAIFSLDKALPANDYELYLKIGDYYFPSREDSFLLRVINAYDVVEDIDLDNIQTIDIVVDALRADIIEALKPEVGSYVDQILLDDPERFRGEKGEPLRYEDMTVEQLDALKGEPGENLVWDNLTAEQIEMITGKDGKSFDYASLSPEEKEEIRGAKGDKGDPLTWDDLTEEQKLSLHGEDGLSAYQVAVENGFQVSEFEWLESLKGQDGQDGTDGQSFDYESLTPEQKAEIKGEQGDKGDSFKYEDFTQEQLDELRGVDGENGKSSYELALETGYVGSLEEYLQSLHGMDGADGTSLTWDDLTPIQKDSLKGEDGHAVNIIPITDAEENEIGYEIIVTTSNAETVSSGVI